MWLKPPSNLQANQKGSELFNKLVQGIRVKRYQMQTAPNFETVSGHFFERQHKTIKLNLKSKNIINTFLLLGLTLVIACKKINAIKSSVTIVVYDVWADKPIKGAKVAFVERKLRTSISNIGGQSNPYKCKDLAEGYTNDNGIVVFNNIYLKKNEKILYASQIRAVYDEVYSGNCDMDIGINKEKNELDTIKIYSPATLTVTLSSWPNFNADSLYITFIHLTSEFHFELNSNTHFNGKKIIDARSGAYKIKIYSYNQGVESIKNDEIYLEPKSSKEYFVIF